MIITGNDGTHAAPVHDQRQGSVQVDVVMNVGFGALSD